MYMRRAEAAALKPGDLVVMGGKSKYEGLIFEIESINPKWDIYQYRITLKQPGFDTGFRIVDYSTRMVHKYKGTN